MLGDIGGFGFHSGLAVLAERFLKLAASPVPCVRAGVAADAAGAAGAADAGVGVAGAEVKNSSSLLQDYEQHP